MNMEYFREHIMEELEGSKHYVKSALELKGSKPEWSKHFLDMAMAELEHAANLYKMMDEHYKSIVGAYKIIPTYVAECHEEIMSKYNECREHVKALAEMYTK